MSRVRGEKCTGALEKRIRSADRGRCLMFVTEHVNAPTLPSEHLILGFPTVLDEIDESATGALAGMANRRAPGNNRQLHEEERHWRTLRGQSAL